MIEILKTTGLPSLSILIILILVFFGREFWDILKTTRLKAQQDILTRIITEIDKQLGEFYLPLAVRFRVSKMLFDTTSKWQMDKKYRNDKLNIKSKNERALRDIVVRRIFLPINMDIETLILEKSYLADPDDDTSYSKILEHMILWRSFEQAFIDGDIEDYEGAGIFDFPSHEVEMLIGNCERLVSQRDNIHKDLISLRIDHKRLFRKKNKARKEVTNESI